MRRRPEETLLYQVIDDNCPDFVARFEAQGRTLPRFVRREFEDYRGAVTETAKTIEHPAAPPATSTSNPIAQSNRTLPEFAIGGL
jgi:hypothetical protein